MGGSARAGVSRALFQAAWRVKHLVRPLVPAAARQAIARALLRRAYPGGGSASSGALADASVRAAYGLNVLGYLRAESGVAEAARCTVRACRAAIGRPMNMRSHGPPRWPSKGSPCTRRLIC